MYNLSVRILLVAAMAGVRLFGADMPQKFYNKEAGLMQKVESDNQAEDANHIRITVVYDNNPHREGFGTSWGFACVITGTEKTILFDTGGNGELLLKNMSKANIDVNSIDIVVLSHIHDDHVGGLEMFLQENPRVSVYLPESFPQEFKARAVSLGARIIEVDQEAAICKQVHSTGQMGTSIKEQGLILRTKKGMIIVTGCAHPGVAEMSKRAKDLFNEPVLLVTGGFHLANAGRDSVENIINAFKKMNVKYAGPTHCTGDKTRAIFAEHFGDLYVNTGVGRIIRVEDLK